MAGFDHGEFNTNQYDMKKILFILPSLEGGGAERVVLSVMRYLDPNRYALTLFLFKREGGVYWQEVPSHVRIVCGTDKGRLRFKIFQVLFIFMKTARSQDLLIGGLELTSTYLAYFAGKIFRKPAIGMVHVSISDYIKPMKMNRRLTAKLIYRYLKILVFVSNGIRENMIKWIPKADVTNWKVIYNIFDESLYQKNLLMQEWTERAFSFPVVIAVGRLSQEKGFDILLSAHAKILQKGLQHNLLILGEGPERKNLENLRQKLSLQETVYLPGFVPNPIDYMKKATVFILSSRNEGFGMVLLEAMAAGIPIISTNCPSGPGEILDNGIYGMLVSPDNPDTIADAVIKLLSDKVLQKQYCDLSKNRVQHFSYHDIIPQWERLISEVCN